MSGRIIAVLAALTFAATTTTAHAYMLGAADGTTQAAPLAAQLGARTYRVVMDSTIPLEAYAQRIETYRALGMKPQIVVDGTGTTVRGKTGRNWQTINYAIRAFRRWPDAYSVSVMNEPNNSGISGCQYAKTFRRAYKMLKAAGVPRVLFGEWAPDKPMEWTAATARCLKSDVIADGWAWHCYDPGTLWYGIQHAGEIRHWLKAARHVFHTSHGNALPVYCTEYGVATRGPAAYGEQDAAQAWATALKLAARYRLAEMVVWQIAETPQNSRWDTSIIDADGRPRPAFATIASRASL